jgi:DNA-binding NarL/FixJ family response regulator
MKFSMHEIPMEGEMKNKIMIVVEGDLYGHLLAREFRSRGYGVCAILDRGEDAIEKAKKEKPDTILLEFLLKGSLDGIETAKKIQQASPTSIVFLNNRLEKKWIKRTGEVKVSAIVNKMDAPPGEIAEMIQTAII